MNFAKLRIQERVLTWIYRNTHYITTVERPLQALLFIYPVFLLGYYDMDVSLYLLS